MADAGPLRTKSPEQNIQEFAETAMKEMLSWYGYERRDSPPTERCQRRDSPPPPLPTAAASAAAAAVAARLSRPTSPVTDGSVSPRPVSPVTAALANDSGCKRTPVVCSWCNKLGAQLYTMGSKAFCSEPCFSQSRVANFRKTKLCDWCKNIRDSLNIEFVNGDQQLQFCSESCLNAYKMNIFCKETEAHIQMLPQLRELVSRSSKDPLITPEMWLRDRPPSGATVVSEAAPQAADDSGAPTPADRRRLRRLRPDQQRAPLRGVRARSHTMPVLELRERARRRPSAPARQQPPPPPPPVASVAAAAAASQPSAAAVAPGPVAPPPPPPPPLWQRYHLLQPTAPAESAPALAPPLGLPPVTVLLPVPVAVPVPVPLPIPVPENFCRELLARQQRREPPPPPVTSADCPILKRELEKESASGSDTEGLDLTVRKRKTDHPRKIKMEEDDFD